MASSILIVPLIISFISSPVGFYPSVREIGYYAKTTSVPSQRVFVESMEERDAVTKAGRSIYGEPNNSGHGFTIRYYYNASENFGKILEVNQIRRSLLLTWSDNWNIMLGR